MSSASSSPKDLILTFIRTYLFNLPFDQLTICDMRRGSCTHVQPLVSLLNPTSQINYVLIETSFAADRVSPTRSPTTSTPPGLTRGCRRTLTPCSPSAD